MSGFKPTYGARGAKKYTGKYQSARSQARYRRVQSKRRQISGMPYTEKKGMDTVLAQTAIIDTTSTNASVDVLNLVRTGTGSWNRIGKRINPTTLRIRGVFEQEVVPTASGHNISGCVVRMVVVFDKQPSGNAIPSFDDIFGYTIQDGTEASVFDASVKYDNTDRFRVLRDKFVDLNLQAVTAEGTENTNKAQYYCDEFIKLPGEAIVFSGQSTPMTISDISSGAIYVFWRKSIVSNSPVIDFTGIARLRYTD